MLNESEIGRRVDSRVELRASTLRLRWEMKGLTSADGHAVNAVFGCAVRALPAATERRMFEETFLASRAVADANDIVAHFAPTLKAAAEKFAGRFDGQDIISDEKRAPFVDCLMQSAGGIAFGCGLEILPPAQLDLDSPSLRERRRESLAHEQAKQAAVQREDQLHHSAELFKQFQAIRESAPELSTAQVLSRVGLADQSDLIRSLLVSSAEKSAVQPLWAVAGPYLMRVELADENVKTQLIPLPPALGPLRSVQAGDDGRLLIGARGGVMSVDPARPENAILYIDPQASSAMGFNCVVARGDEIWATHADAGLVCWVVDVQAAPARSIRRADANISQFSPHHLTAVDDRLLLASGSQLFSVDEQNKLSLIETGQRDEIQAIVPQGNGVLVVYSNGQLCAVDINSAAPPCQQRRVGRISAASPMPWVHETRLLLATEDGPIVCAGFEDELITQYSSAYPSLRILAASAAKIAAVTSDRQRVILWNPWDGRKPAGEIHLAGLARHRIADICFI